MQQLHHLYLLHYPVTMDILFIIKLVYNVKLDLKLVLHQHLPVLLDMYLLMVSVKLVQVKQFLVKLVVQLKVITLDLPHVIYVMQMLQDVVLILQHQDVMEVISYLLQIHVQHAQPEQVYVHLQLILLNVKLDISKDQAQ